MAVKLNAKYTGVFVAAHELEAIAPLAEAAHKALFGGTGAGNEFLGWRELPANYDKEEFKRIEAAAQKIREDTGSILIVLGIGGSYLGARAAIQFLKGEFYNDLAGSSPRIYFAGNNLSAAYISNILRLCEGKSVYVNVISKSGTTTETALAFRIFREYLAGRYTKEDIKRRIFCTTDKARGTLKELAVREGYETFVVPDDIGGRYSVLTAVGLLPIAVAGVDINELMRGAKEAQDALSNFSVAENDAVRYAALRNILYNKGKNIEIMVSYDPGFAMMAEWFKQLFGESEGKDQKGIFPASVTFSTDLHSLGQYIQDGRRSIFETVVAFEKEPDDFDIKPDPENLDGLNFLSGNNFSCVNKNARQGTILAHTEGGVPNIVLEIPENSPYELGYLIYFFELSCGLSGYMLGVNPFDQPGVESYKRNMFALLGKPGHEARREELLSKL
ncbi:MAG: glucose-6-phosphate isomerase [Oscillospiraceae bacterium]|jgi:glucose-6-phosphate isomerase|nr:glucose-6-phosphate isomerase [Oscillospiraceae bacterium]